MFAVTGQALTLRRAVVSIPKPCLAVLLLFSICSSSFPFDRVNVTATDLNAMAPSAYRFTFVCGNSISADAQIQIIFPQNYTLTNTVLASSKSLNGGLAVSVKGDTVEVRRSGLGVVLEAGELCDLTLATLLNPSVMKKQYRYELLILENGYVRDRDTITASISPFRSARR